MKVFITGSSAQLAKILLPLLCADERITHVTGVDIKPCQFAHDKFTFHKLDMRNAALCDLMRGHDVLIHLAFVVLRGKMNLNEMYDINVRGSLQVFGHASELGIRRMLHMSSASVYGQGENLDEHAELNPIPGFVYAEHKTLLENELHARFPEVLCIRPHIILGPNALPLLKYILKMPFYPKLSDPQPLLQCVHENDVAQAVYLSIFSGLSGAVNLAATQSMSFRDMVKIHQPRAIAVPIWMVKPLLKLVWRISGWGGEPAWLDGAEHSLTLNCERARRELQWQATYATQEVIRST